MEEVLKQPSGNNPITADLSVSSDNTRVTLDELLRAVEARSMTPDEFLKVLWAASAGHRRELRRCAPGTVDVYRTRPFDAAERTATISALSYPPADKCVLQRASGDREQVFYGSAGLPTTLAESRVKAGQHIVVSRWRNIEELLLQPVGLTNEDGLERVYRHIFTERSEAIYPYSSKVAEHLLKGDLISGLLYPSIANNNMAHNVAIKRDHVDNRLRFVNATLYSVNSITSDAAYSVTPVDFATPLPDARLDWKGRTKQWKAKKQGEALHLVSNGWDWNAFDAEGRYVDPE